MSSDLQPVLLEVLAHMPTDLFHCMHCEQLFDAAGIGRAVHQQIQADYPQEMLEEVGRLAGWLQDLSARHGEQLHIRIIDPQSLEGFVKSLRHWVGKYPAFIIDGQEKHVGWEPTPLNSMLEERIAQRTAE